MSRICAVLLLLVAATLGGPAPRIINEEVDKQMKAHNAMLTKLHLDKLPISGATTDGVTFGNGFQLGANTMKRTGDGEEAVSPDGKVKVYKYRIGFAKLGFSFDKIVFDNDGGLEVSHPRFEVGKNTVDFDFTIDRTSECKVTLDNYKFTSLEDVKVVEGTLSEEQVKTIQRVLLTHMNAVLDKKRAGVEQHLQPMCKANEIGKF